MKLINLMIMILGLFILLVSYDIINSYINRIDLTKAEFITTKGVVTGFAGGTRWNRFFVKWYDNNGKAYFTKNNEYDILPNVGDSIEIIYKVSEPDINLINSETELTNNYQGKIKRLFLLFILSLLTIIYCPKDLSFNINIFK